MFAIVLLICAAGGGLVLWATGRVWVTEVVTRTAPLASRHVPHTGTSLVPWIAALGWAGLAGTGALIATHRAGRIVVGLLLAGCGVGVLAAVGYALFGVDGHPNAWPLLAALGAVGLLSGGVAALRYGGTWPTMGTRFDSPAAPAGRATARKSTVEADMWNALDRGEDPTTGAGRPDTWPATDGPTTDGPAAGRSPTDGPAAGRSPTDGPAAGRSPTDGPAADGSSLR